MDGSELIKTGFGKWFRRDGGFELLFQETILGRFSLNQLTSPPVNREDLLVEAPGPLLDIYTFTITKQG
jgi:hypothetical protein